MVQAASVIKCGGSSLPNLSKAFANLVATWQRPLVIVHGGGPAIAELEKALGLKSNFNAKGQRITDQKTLEVVVQCLCGQVNSDLVSLLSGNGVPAFGLSGIDGGLLRAQLKDFAELGWVGEIIDVRTKILQNLCEQGLVPVVAPVSLSPTNQLLNVNADDAASAIAKALEAKTMIFVSDVPGIMDERKQIFETLNVAQIGKLMASGVIHGGMIPKVEAAISALQDSTLEQVLIMDGTQPSQGTSITLT